MRCPALGRRFCACRPTPASDIIELMSERAAKTVRLGTLLLIVSGCGGGSGAPLPPKLAQTTTVDQAVAEAIEAVYAKVEDEPDRIGHRMQLAGVYEANGARELAGEVYEQIVELDPENSRAWYHLARLRQVSGDTDGALAAFEAVMANKNEEPHPPLHWRRGRLHLELGNLDEAESAFRRAMDLAPDDPSGRFGLAEIALERENVAEAVAALQALDEAYSGDVMVTTLLARALRRSGEEEKATEVEATKGTGSRIYIRDPWLAEIAQQHVLGKKEILGQAEAYLKAGNPQAAMGLLHPALEKEPTDLGLLGRATDALVQMGQLDQALKMLVDAKKRLPETYRLELNLGIVLHYKRDLPKAIAALTRATELAPVASEGHFCLARALADAGQVEKALESTETAIELGKTDEMAYVLRGQIYVMLWRFEEALAQFDDVLVDVPEHPVAKAFRAACLVELKRFDEARAQIAELEALDPATLPPVVVRETLPAARQRMELLEKREDPAPDETGEAAEDREDS